MNLVVSLQSIMINIVALLMMLLSMTSAIKPIALDSSAVIIVPSVTVLQWPSASVKAEHCYLRHPKVAKRDDYTYTPGIGGHKLHSKTVRWNEARMTCEEEGGHLAIINSIAESEAIAELFKKSPASPQTTRPHLAHVGFHDLFKKRQFVTIHGESIANAGFTGWGPGQPNDWKGNERCGSVTNNGQLNDINCDDLARFICEIPMPSM